MMCMSRFVHVYLALCSVFGHREAEKYVTSSTLQWSIIPDFISYLISSLVHI